MTTQSPQVLDTLAGRTSSQTFLPVFFTRAPTQYDIGSWKVGQRWIDTSFTRTATITGITQANPAVITATNSFSIGQIVTFSGVGGMTQLNNNSYEVIAANGLTFTINTDSTGFGAYTSGGIATAQVDDEYILNGFKTFNGVTTANWVLLNAGAAGGSLDIDLHDSRLIVGIIGEGANYSTITSALNAASDGDTIFIQTGIYTEDITLKAGVNLCASECDALTPTVTILGLLSYSSAGSVSITGINLQTNGNFFLSVTGSAASVVNLYSCFLNATNNTGINFDSSSSLAQLNIFYSGGDVGAPGIAYYAFPGAGGLFMYYSEFINSGGSAAVNLVSGTGNASHFYCEVNAPFETTGSGCHIDFEHCFCATVETNSIFLTHNSTFGTPATIRFCNIESGSASAVSIGAGAGLGFHGGNTIVSSNTNAITGAGTVSFDYIGFEGSSSNTINTSTQTANAVRVNDVYFQQSTTPLTTYVEGTFTPTVFGSSTAGTTTYTIQQGNYTQIGNTVFCFLFVKWSAMTGTGVINVGGLPVTANATANIAPIGKILYSGAAAAYPTGSINSFIQVLPGTTTAQLLSDNITGTASGFAVANGVANLIANFSYII